MKSTLNFANLLVFVPNLVILGALSNACALNTDFASWYLGITCVLMAISLVYSAHKKYYSDLVIIFLTIIIGSIGVYAVMGMDIIAVINCLL